MIGQQRYRRKANLSTHQKSFGIDRKSAWPKDAYDVEELAESPAQYLYKTKAGDKPCMRLESFKTWRRHIADPIG